MSLSVPDEATNVEEQIRRYLEHEPAKALALLPVTRCEDTRMKLTSLLAHNRARADINTAWHAVARSSLGAKEKQLIFNELWN